MLTSKVVLGLIVTNLCSNFGVSLFITCLPMYINDVLEFDIASVKKKTTTTFKQFEFKLISFYFKEW